MAANPGLAEAASGGGNGAAVGGGSAGVVIGANGLDGGETCGGLIGAMGVGLGNVVMGGAVCAAESSFPGDGFGIFPELSEDPSEETPPAAIDAVPAAGLVM